MEHLLGVQQEHGTARVPAPRLAGQEAPCRFPAAVRGAAVKGIPAQRTLGDGSLPCLGGPCRLGYAGAGDRLLQPGAVGGVSLAQWQVPYCRGSPGKGLHCSPRFAGTCAGAVSAPFGQRPCLQGSCCYPLDINSPLPRRRSPPPAPVAQPETHQRLPPAIVWS